MPVDVVGRDVEAGGGDRGRPSACQCSWKLDSSTASTSYGSGCSTASSSGVPTLPALVARSPAARRIEASICTVVVLPLVPVTVSHGAAPTRGRIRQASSTSPQTGMPAAAAATSSGVVGRQPGEVTTSSVPSRHGDQVLGADPHVDAEDVQDVRPLADRVGRVGASTAVTCAPRSASASAAAKPLTPRPGHEHPQAGPVGVAVGQAGWSRGS